MCPCRAHSQRSTPLQHQRGAVLLIMLIILIAGASAMLLRSLNSSTMRLERDKVTADALTQAKQVLIGYAITYGDRNPNNVSGYLPLPDLGSSRNNIMTPGEGYAAGNFSGNSKNLTVIGRLPWRKLGLPPIRDSEGECLWYAVSGSFQDIQKANVLNWDSVGHFDAYSSNGTAAGTLSTTGANQAQRPVAIIFAAGGVLDGQNRNASATDTVSICGGNYNVRNYLDSFNSDANINSIVNYFSGTTNNATGFAYNLTNASDGSQLSAADISSPKNVISGDTEVVISGATVKIANDKILAITIDDIFRPIIRRSDFSGNISALLNDAAFIAHLQSTPITGTKGTNQVDCSTPSTISNRTFCANWKEMLLLTRLTPTSNITIFVNGTPTTFGPCGRVLIFGGQKNTGQSRVTTADKSAPANYLENQNLAAFAIPNAISGNFSGNYDFNVNNPSADLLRCLP